MAASKRHRLSITAPTEPKLSTLVILMKQCIVALLLCLLLAGCGDAPILETTPVVLPTPATPTNAAELSPIQATASSLDREVVQLGDPFSELSQRGEVLLQGWNCLVRRNVLYVATYNSASGQTQSEQSVPIVYAAFSADGQTVTGLITWVQRLDGTWSCASEGIEPIEPVADPAALSGLSAEALEARLGPCQVDIGSGAYIPCWFTVDGKLIVSHDLFYSATSDLILDTPGPQLLDLLFEDPDLIRVRYLDSSTEIENEARWNAFLETTARGEPDEVTLRIYHRSTETAQDSDDPEGGPLLPLYSDCLLRYDGALYSIMYKPALSVASTTAENWSSYPYLIVSLEEAPRPQMKWRSATYYLLSADPNMTHERLFSFMVSSVYNPDFPETDILFTVYHGDEWKKYEKP